VKHSHHHLLMNSHAVLLLKGKQSRRDLLRRSMWFGYVVLARCGIWEAHLGLAPAALSHVLGLRRRHVVSAGTSFTSMVLNMGLGSQVVDD